MQVEVQLICKDREMLSHDYLYSMASMLKKHLTEIREDFGKELYSGAHKNKIKMFVFSPLNSMPKPKSVRIEGEKRDRMLLGERCWFRIASPWPELINIIGESLLRNRDIRIMNKNFYIRDVNIIAPPEFKETMVWKPFGQAGSICTSWSSKEKKEKYFIFPDEQQENTPDCAQLLKNNLKHKFHRLKEIRPDIAEDWLKDVNMSELPQNGVEVDFLPLFVPNNSSENKNNNAIKNCKHVMHYGKNTVIRSWRCRVKIKAPIPIQRLIWSTGLGNMNSQGYGLTEEVHNNVN